MIHHYIEIPIALPTPITATVDVLGSLRLRVNTRDLTPELVLKLQETLQRVTSELLTVEIEA